MKNLFFSIASAIILSGCISTTTLSWPERDVIFIQKEYVEVSTHEGKRKMFATECRKFRLIGDKEEYFPGEFLMGGCVGSTYLITGHYKGSIKVDRKAKVVILALYYAGGGALPENGKYKYDDF